MNQNSKKNKHRRPDISVSFSKVIEAQKDDLVLSLEIPVISPLLEVCKDTKDARFIHHDDYAVQTAKEELARRGIDGIEPGFAFPHQLEIRPDILLCSFSRDDEKDLSEEVLAWSVALLKTGGKLVARIANPKDRWLHDRLNSLLGSCTLAFQDKKCRVYVARKKGKCRWDFPDKTPPVARTSSVRVNHGGERLDFFVLPGCFSSKRLDPGSKELLRVMDDMNIQDASRILDLGCGWGPLGILCARRYNSDFVYFLDSNHRATHACRLNTVLLPEGCGHEIRVDSRATAFCSDKSQHQSFDLIVSNPPYGKNFEVSEDFARAASRALRRDGIFCVVGKSKDRLGAILNKYFRSIETFEQNDYVVSA